MKNPCKECITLSLCRGKTWYPVLADCSLLRVYLADNFREVEKNTTTRQSVFFGVHHLDMAFRVSRSGAGDVMIGAF